MAINCAIHLPAIREQARQEKNQSILRKQRDRDLVKLAKEVLSKRKAGKL